MKSLKSYISESKTAYDGPEFFEKYYYNNLNYKYYNKETGVPTLEELQEAYGTTALTGDPSFLRVNDTAYEKIGNNKWESQTLLAHAVGGKKTDEEIFKLLKNAKTPWFVMLRAK